MLSDAIELFIKELLKFGETELQRNELASRFGCAPSQINYVLATRFSLERGYIITSRRGGGGYIKIMRVELDRDNCVFDMALSVGDTLSGKAANGMLLRLLDTGAITCREASLMCSALGSLDSGEKTAHTRANMLRAMLTAIMEQSPGNDALVRRKL